MTKNIVLLIAASVLTVLLFIISLFVGVYDITVFSIFEDPMAAWFFAVTRIPRSVSLILCAMALGISGAIAQMITQNKFVEATTIGVTEWAAVGYLVGLIYFPSTSLVFRMVLAIIMSFIGTLFFLFLLQKIRLKSSLIVPLVGIMLGSVIGAIATYIATYYDLLQSLGTLRSGSFASVVRGRYEVLYIILALVIIAYIMADRFSAAGLGKDIATNLGINYRAIIFMGSAVIALNTGVVTVVVGALPFIGLIVPNIISMIRGDNLRSNLPWIVIISSMLIIVCDIIGRVVKMPYELPASLILGIVGALTFIAIVLYQRREKSASKGAQNA